MSAFSFPASFRIVIPARTPFARAVWQWLVQAKRLRDTRRQLAEMDDRMLADIGVSRAAAQFEAARPAWDCSRAAF